MLRWFFGCFLALHLAASPAGAGETVTVFAAASLKTALDEVSQAYAASGEARPSLSYASSSALARQILQGAPAQVFISANEAWMDQIETSGALAEGTRTQLLTGELVLIASQENQVSLTLQKSVDIATALGSGRLAMALVDAVPAGIYGRAALMALDSWEGVKSQIAQTDNVRAALRLVSLGEAPMGIVYATDAMADPNVRVVAAFPADSHPPIRYPAAIVAANDSVEARRFMAFLTGPRAKSIFRKHGFGIPDDGS